MKLSWDQALCDGCWEVENPDRAPVRVRNADLERCALCGRTTYSGIYVRADPATVEFPRWEEA